MTILEFIPKRTRSWKKLFMILPYFGQILGVFPPIRAILLVMNFTELAGRLVYSSFQDRVRLYTDPKSPKVPYRSLTPEEITTLTTQGNRCKNWSAVSVAFDFSPAGIWDCRFYGACYLGVFSDELTPYRIPGGTVDLAQGLYDSVFTDSQIGDGSAVHRCPRVQGVRMGTGVALVSSSLAGGNVGTYGNGTNIPIGVEIGGRNIRVFADLSLEMAKYVLDRPGNTEALEEFDQFVNSYLAKVQSQWTIVDDDAVIIDCRNLADSYVGPRAYLHQPDSIEGSTVLSTPEDPTEIGPGSIVRRSILQEGVKVDSGALVFSSMLFEQSYATEHGKVQDSIVGPNSGVSLGEATASFMGPFVGFHHQSLLIANYWPGGRGNIGYGANVGSNHTSRMPDQECWPGEGMFFGLSSVIKYPANFRQAPYSIVAAGVTTLPQKMTCPFSLINEPVAYYLEVPPGFNNLIPAWGLTDNLYSLKRNEGKYKARNKAKRNTFELELFRPEILAYMATAIKDLKKITERKTIYLPSDIPSIGKNMMTDENRLRAIKAYQFFIDLTEYRHLRNAILTGGARPAAGMQLGGSPTPEGSSGKSKLTPLEKLNKYLSMVPELLTRTIASRERDFARGLSIIDDYDKTHGPVEDDPFVRQTAAEVKNEIALTWQAIEILDSRS